MIHDTTLQQIDPIEPIDHDPPIDLAEKTDLDTPRERVSALSRILRGIGATVLVAAASVFLLQRWTSGDDLLRYGALIGLTVAFAATGIACGLVLRESKAARTLLALVMGLVPVHAAVLGGFIYSRFGSEAIAGHLPAFGVWIAGSDLIALLVTGGALLLLLPLVYLGARALARPHAVMVTVVTFAINLPLLLPFRGATAIGVVVAALTALLLTFELRWIRRKPALRTTEGRLVRLLWTMPLVIAVVRTHLYSPTALFYGVVLMTLAGALFASGRLLTQRLNGGLSAFGELIPQRWGLARQVEALSLVPAAVGWLFIVWELADIPWADAVWYDNLLLVVSWPIAAMMIVMSLYTLGDGSRFRWGAAALALMGTAANLIVSPSVGHAFLCLTIAITAVAYSFIAEHKLLLVGGLAAAAFGLVYQIRFALDFYSWSRWGGLAAIGLATIVAAALLERHQATVVSWTRLLSRRMKSWSL